MISRTRQRAITITMIVAASLALGIGAVYQGERLPDSASPVIGDASSANNGQDGGSGGASGETATPVSPIEGFLPRSGEASACREPVGVDLIPGYAATLTINGVVIAPEQMNVVTNEDGEITEELTASRTLFVYTFGPEPDCPNGEILRATNNVMRACVYRLEDGPANCTITEVTFDVL